LRLDAVKDRTPRTSPLGKVRAERRVQRRGKAPVTGLPDLGIAAYINVFFA
jgi:hypothetical protein